jgi:quinol-cytochrome oxidoreductase complex cytochrome b subunit
MDTVTGVVLLLLPFVLLLVLFLLVRPFLKRQRQRDRESPPTPKAMAVRMTPFLGVAAAGGVWATVREDWPLAAMAVGTVLAFVVSSVMYARHRRD